MKREKLRIIKYILTSFGVFLTYFLTDVSFSVFIRIRENATNREAAMENLIKISPFYFGIILIVAILNWLVEKKLEKNMKSNEFLRLSFFQIITSLVIAFYFYVTFDQASC